MKKALIVHIVFISSSFSSLFGQSFFQDVTAESGIEHCHIAPNLMGGGIAVLDYDNDGFEDLYFTGGVYEDKLYKNNGNGTFTYVGISAGIYDVTRILQTTSAVTGDIDNDGWDDIFVSSEPGEYNILFHNNGDGTFTNINIEADILDKSWSMGASFIDINLDGYLDIYVINYIDESNTIIDDNGSIVGFAHKCFPNTLYINNGDNTFSERSSLYKVDSEGCGLAVTASDINGDYVPDIYIANDFGEWVIPNQVFQNDYPNAQFLDKGEELKLNVGLYGMGISIGDVDKNGALDYYVTNLGENALLSRTSENTFQNITQEAGVGNEKVGEFNATSWGTQLFDVDHDGDEDLYVSNGYIGAAPFLQTTVEDPNKLFLNNGLGVFEDISLNSGMNNISISRGSALLDYDNDGDMDLVVSNISNVRTNPSNISVYENTVGQEKNWLKVKLKGTSNNANGYGSKVYCYVGEEIFVEEIYGGGSHASKSTAVGHFGLNEAETIDSLVVIWPGGNQQRFNSVETNQFLMIEEASTMYEVIGCMDNENVFYNEKASFNSGCFVEEPPVVLSLANRTGLPSRFEVAPNPVTSRFVVSTFTNKRIKGTILDAKGVAIMDIEVLRNSELDLENLKDGLYIIVLEGLGAKQILKLSD